MTKKLLRTLIALCCALLAFLLGLTQEPNLPDGNSSDNIAFAQQLEQAMQPMQENYIYYCTKDEFISCCLACRIRPDKIEYVWDLLRGQYSIDDLANKYCLEYDTVKRDKWKYKKKLLKKT